MARFIFRRQTQDDRLAVHSNCAGLVTIQASNHRQNGHDDEVVCLSESEARFVRDALEDWFADLGPGLTSGAGNHRIPVPPPAESEAQSVGALVFENFAQEAEGILARMACPATPTGWRHPPSQSAMADAIADLARLVAIALRAVPTP